MKKILVLSHEATLTGAPIYLLRLINFLNNSNNYKFYFFFKSSGTLISDFQNHGKTLVLDDLNSSNSSFTKVLIRFFPIYRLRNYLFKLKISFFQADLIISNTIANSALLEYISLEKADLITIVHEMKGVINQFDQLKINNSKKIFSNSSHFVAVSNAVEFDLINEFKLSKKKITVILNTVLSKKINLSVDEKINWKKQYNIPNDAFIIGSCGSLIWRKGPDIFISILKRFKEKYPKEKIFFIWQGGHENSSYYYDLMEELNKLSLSREMVIIPFNKRVQFFYNSIDLYISTAREEPFGLTLLEAGLYKKPCIAFEKSGGPEETLKNNTGLLIPYGNIEIAVDSIFKIKNNKQKYSSLSNNINKAALENNSKNNFTKYKEIIDKFMK